MSIKSPTLTKEPPSKIQIFEKATNRLILETTCPKILSQLEGAVVYLEGREVISLEIKEGPHIPPEMPFLESTKLEVELGEKPASVLRSFSNEDMENTGTNFDLEFTITKRPFFDFIDNNQ